MYYKSVFLFLQILISFAHSELSLEKKDKLLNGFIDFYNHLPDQVYTCEEGSLQNAEHLADNCYKIEVSLQVTNIHNLDSVKNIKCTANIQELQDGVSVIGNEHHCEDVQQAPVIEEVITTESAFVRKPVQLDNEVESNTAVTSGEQFIAVPREEPGASCIGCSTHINPQAAGVTELATLAVRHLDRHDSTVRHTLNTVLDVERQVQVVNGVRYILTLLVDYNNCTETQTESCQSSNTCKISLLEKPWVRLPRGGKYRAIIANNCTEEWLFEENGELIAEDEGNNRENNEIEIHPKENNAGDDIITAVHTGDAQAQQNQVKILTVEQVKSIEEQVIPHSQFSQLGTTEKLTQINLYTDPQSDSKEHLVKEIDNPKHFNRNTISQPDKKGQSSLNDDKKKTIEELMNFFEFSAFISERDNDKNTRSKRSYDHDLEAMLLADDFQTLYKSIKKGKYLYHLAQIMVDYLNEIDLVVKTRTLKDVIKVEDEIVNYQHFYYIQARVLIPCDKAVCELKDTEKKICNGIIETTDKKQPQVFSAFCYNDREDTELNKVNNVPLDDPLLLKLLKESIKKIEKESLKPNALNIREIISANTQKVLGTLTKASIILEYLNCTKDTPTSLRSKCTVVDELGFNVCEVLIHEKHKLKEHQIVYNCIERPIGISYADQGKKEKMDVDDPIVKEMVLEALQYLELQSNKNNKQKIVTINSVATQLNAGLVTKIQFIVGYTSCSSNTEVDVSNCPLLATEPLRKCIAQIWDRTWIEEGRQVEVVCDAVSEDNVTKQRKRRSLYGGETPKDVNDPQYRTLAEESLSKYIQVSGGQQHFNLVGLKHVTVQVVTGKLTRIDFTISPTDCRINSDGQPSSSTCKVIDPGDTAECHSEIWERPWLQSQKKEVSVDCLFKKLDKRDRRSVVGGKTEQNPNNPYYSKLAEKSLSKYLQDTGTTISHKLVKVEKVTTQVVSGTLTEIHFTVLPTNSDIINCVSKVWEQPWKSTEEIDVNCGLNDKKSRAKRKVVGGETDQDPNKPLFEHLAEESMQKYLQSTGITNKHTVVRVVKASTQVVSGSLTQIDFLISPVDMNSGDIIKCHSKIWEQPWLNNKEITVDCKINNQKYRAKREVLTGGQTEQDPKDPKYTQLAEESMQKYLQSTGITNQHKVARVVKASTQVVSGSLTRIDFLISPVDVNSGDVIKCHSKIWEQPWLNNKEITVDCKINNQKYRAKREVLTGGQTEQDPKDPKYTQLAEESMQKYLQSTGITNQHKVARVVKATTQVVSGSLTRIDFLISPVDVNSGDVIKCHSKIWEQPWLNNKEITVDCKINNQKYRAKREVQIGGQTEQDPKDPKYTQLAKESMQKYLLSTGITNQHKVARVVKATTQVVSGSLTRIDFLISPVDVNSGDVIKCHSKIWEQPWLNNKEITVDCKINNQKYRAKREVLTGGQTEQDPKDPKYTQLAEESMQKYLQSTGITNQHKVARVVKASTQVVSGSLTQIDFLISPVDMNSGDIIKCHSKIWEQPWLNNKEITVDCKINNQKYRAKREVLTGGQTEQDPKDPKYTQLAEESMQKYLQSTGITNQHKVARVVKATTQVVSGSLTRIDFLISPVDVNSGDVIKCHSKIWEQPWLNNKEITVDCKINNQKYRAKREVQIGGQTEQDPKDPKYTQLAKESMQKYLLSTGITNQHKVARVVKATTQVVSGSLTRIDFLISPVDVNSGDVIKCHSKIWEQPWLNNKEITVDCKINNQKYRAKREVLTGGQTEQDPKDPKYTQLAEESMQKYLQSTGITNQHKVARVVKVTTQVVSGSLTRIDFLISPVDVNSGDVIKCHSKIWEQPWLNNKEITVDCKINNQKYRAKREVQIGGQTEQDPKDPKYTQLAKESMQKYLQSTGITNQHKVARVVKASTQVVSGSLTQIDFLISPVDMNSGDIIKCHSKIWEQPWLNNKEITVDCKINNQKYRAKREVQIGGQTEQDPKDPKYTQLAEESMQKYLLSTGIANQHKVVRVVKVTTQVVSGSLTRIDFLISPVDMNSGDVIKCYSKIWEQPWLNNKEITVDCKINNQKYRAKREVPTGGQTEQDPKDPKYTQLAEESMQKYLQSTGIAKPHKIVTVYKVTTQVVSGVMTRIYFGIQPIDKKTEDVISCVSKIWQQSWINTKQIEVECKIDSQKYRAKRQIPGGENEKNPNNPSYKKIAEESLAKYLQSTGITDPHIVVAVEKVTTQVVSGTLTTIYFTISSANKPEDTRRCVSKVWEQPWMQKKDIDVNCAIDNQESRIKREILHKFDARQNNDRIGVGTTKEVQNPSKNEYKLLAIQSLRKYQLKKKSKHAHKVIEVNRVQTQVVSGLIYEIDFTAVPTTCSPKVSDATFCKEKLGSVKLSCHTKIWSQPWMKRKEITVSCNPHTTQIRKKRNLDLEFEYEIPENGLEADAKNKRQAFDDEEIIDEELKYYYADRAIQHINQASNTNNLDKLISIHAVDSSVHMGANMVRLYIETASTFCLKHSDEENLPHCDEMDGMDHKLCLARLWPSPDDELVVQSISVVCDDDNNFASVSGLSIPDLLRTSIKKLENSPDQKYKLVHLGEPQVIPSLNSNVPIKIDFIVGFTNCTKDVSLEKKPLNCFLDSTKSSKPCTSFIWFVPNSREIYQIDVKCRTPGTRKKRSISMNLVNATADELEIQKLVKESLEKLEMSSIHRYKQRVIMINSYSTKITGGKVTTIDFDVGYTSCLKYEWVDDITTCEFLEHLPRRHCVSQVFERLWLQNGRNIQVTCEDDETPLEAHIEFESAEMAMQLAKEALKHIEAKYPHPRKQKVVRIFSLEKQVVAGIHYRLKIEIGLTDCSALSAQTDCKLTKDEGLNRFCRVNVWLRPWTDHPPNYRVTCDYHEAATADVYHQLQAEHLFYKFLSTYKPDYINDRTQMRQRFMIFKENVRKMHELNTHERGTATYGVTRFADLTYEEFSTKHMGLKTSLRNPNQVPFSKGEIPKVTLPDSFDWRDHGAVTDVKNQGSCGSCWAFSVTGNIEGQWKVHTGKLISLSEQELVDCDKMDQGCNGGLPDNAYRAIEEMGGLETESDYPYEGADDKCSFNKTLARVQISGAVNITSNETDMAKWLVKNGPISIGINANAMQFYMGGISHPWRMLCNPSNLDHGVLIVGYGSKDYPLFHKHLPYWTIKNSWGTSWGEQGYYRVYRGDGTCGVNQMASSAVI